jgi:hypothetical protein
MKIGQRLQRLALQNWRTGRDVGARSVSLFKNANSGEKAQAVSQAGAANAEALGQLSFRRQSITGLQFAPPDHFPNLIDDLLGNRSVAIWSNHLEFSQTYGLALIQDLMLRHFLHRGYRRPPF